jgi:hypothetical protein
VPASSCRQFCFGNDTTGHPIVQKILKFNSAKARERALHVRPCKPAVADDVGH